MRRGLKTAGEAAKWDPMGRELRPKAESGRGSRDSKLPAHQLRDLEEHCELYFSGVWGGAQTAQRFSTIVSTHDGLTLGHATRQCISSNTCVNFKFAVLVCDKFWSIIGEKLDIWGGYSFQEMYRTTFNRIDVDPAGFCTKPKASTAWFSNGCPCRGFSVTLENPPCWNTLSIPFEKPLF